MVDRKRMLRVDQAGEYGATRIYAGQLAVMGNRGKHSESIRAMAVQEAEHLRQMNAMMIKEGVRPSALQPLWSIAGFALGAGTALLGPEAAMACTAAVEEEIDRHYTAQLDELAGEESQFTEMVHKFREDEREHRETALASGAEQAPAYPLLSGAIRLGCRLAIKLAERV